MKPAPTLHPEPSLSHCARLVALLLGLLLLGLSLGCAHRPPPAAPVVDYQWRWDEHGWHRDPVVRL